MGILQRIANAFRPEQRDVGNMYSVGFGFYPGGGTGLGLDGISGLSATGNTYGLGLLAEQVATIMASVSLISSTISALPAIVYKREGAGRVEAPQHPVARLLKAPNDRQTWPDFAEWAVAQILLHGNCLALIEADGNGQPTSLIPVPWYHVMPLLIPGTQRLAYDVLQLGPWGGSSFPRRVLDTEVLHIRDRSDDSFLGRSRISRAPQTIQAALGIQEYSTSIWRNAASPSGVLTTDKKLSKEVVDRLSGAYRDMYTGASNARKVQVLEEGLTFTAISSSPEDAEVLASRRFSAEDCARLMGVPPPLVGIWDHSSFGSPASAASWLAQFTVLPIVRKIEAEFARTVFADPSGPYHLELDMTGLMRGDPTAQQAANVANVAAGIMTVDEARYDLGLNPMPAAPAAPLDGSIPGNGT